MSPQTRCKSALLAASIAAAPVCHADVVFDGTMGTPGALAGPDFLIDAADGNTVGTNLFHSFSEFDLTNTQSATFSGPGAIENILGRISSGSLSSIDGQISSTIPSANLFLLNPNGIMFGPSASLDINGSFYASTGDYIALADGIRFNALPSPDDALLTMAHPIAFGFLGNTTGTITVNDSRLQVPQGESLSFIGGDISITGSSEGRAGRPWQNIASDPVVVGAPGGRIDLVGVASAGEVPLQPDTPGTDGFSAYGDISISDSVISVSDDTAGAVYIRGGEIVIDSASVLSETVDGDGGDIMIDGNNVVVRDDEFRCCRSMNVPSIRTLTFGAGDGGAIRVNAQSLVVDGGVFISTRTFDAGRSGDLVLDTARLEIHRTGQMFTESEGTGRGGDITIDADSVVVTNDTTSERDSGISAWAFDEGDSGDITINARTIELNGSDTTVEVYVEGSGNGGDFTMTADSLWIYGLSPVLIEGYHEGGVFNQTWGTGDAGIMDIRVGRIELYDGASIGGGTFFGGGNAGSVHIEADSILVSDTTGIDFNAGTGIHSYSAFSGDAAPIEITTGSLELRGGFVNNATIGGRQGADISISAGSVLLDNGGVSIPPAPAPPEGIYQLTYISSNSELGGGPSGNVRIDADSLVLRGGAGIFSGTDSASPGGDVIVDAGSILIETDGRIDTRTWDAGTGGNVTINADNLTLNSGGNLAAASGNSGPAGHITIAVTDTFESIGGFVSTEAVEGDGGNITLNATNLVYLLDASISTSVESGTGAGGNISIDPEFVVLNNGTITANAFGGPGGNISIVAGNFFVTPDSVIAASSAENIDGTVIIRSPDTNFTAGITELPESYLDASSLLPERCVSQSGSDSSFIVAGRGGVRPDPDGYLSSSPMELDTVDAVAAGTKATADSADRTDNIELANLECGYRYVQAWTM